MANRIVISVSEIETMLNITNSQSTPTQAGLQVMWQVPVSTLQACLIGLNNLTGVNSNLSNLRFVYNGQFVPAWLESINNGTATIWIKMPVSIPANSSITLNLYVNPNLNFDDVYWGEAPQLSSTYAQYDNGASVFSFYDNFAGTSLNTNKWTTVSAPPSGTITVNNGVSLINTGNNVYYVSSTSFTAPYVIDMGGTLGIEADNGPWFDLESTTSTANTGYLWATRGSSASSVGDQLFTDSNGSYGSFATASGYSGTSNFAIYTLEDIGGSSGTIDTFVNYSSWLSGASTSFTHSGYFSPFRHYNNNSPVSIFYWVRSRAYPPNGVMPSVELM